MRAAIDLARHYDLGEPVQVKEIAERQDIPKDYLSLIMVDLRKGGVVESVRGPRGGSGRGVFRALGVRQHAR